MNRRDLMTSTGLAAVLMTAARPGLGEITEKKPSSSLAAHLEPYLKRYDLPALAAAVVKNGEIAASGVVGTRRVRSDNPVTPDDRFHIGSDTKAMTALLAATLVEGGKIDWSSTVADIYPELTDTMTPAAKGIRLDQLLSHTSGMPSDNDAQEKLLLRSFGQSELNLDELRYWLVKEALTQPLQSPPGQRFAYSNIGYTVAGAMLERLGGATWEELIAARIFDPLGLTTAGFGPQARLGRVDAPIGHRPRPDGTLKPMLAGPNGDNPEIIGPAGTVHLSIRDFAIWAGWNAGQGRRGPPLVSADTMRKLHTPVIDIPPRPDAKPGTPPPGRYGFGWGTVTMPFSPEPVLFHGGSNEMNLAYIMLQPEWDFAMVLMTNVGGTKADEALRAVSAELYGNFGTAR